MKGFSVITGSVRMSCVCVLETVVAWSNDSLAYAQPTDCSNENGELDV